MKMQDLVNYYQLIPHPEGGYYRQIDKSAEILDEGQGKQRARYTSIYFLLTHDNPSRFHRLTSDEIWYFHLGSPLTVHMISPEGEYKKVELGSDLSKGQVLQFTVPKGYIFGSTVEEPEGFAFVSCMVAPGFEFDDFTLFTRQALLETYPQHQEIVRRLTSSEL